MTKKGFSLRPVKSKEEEMEAFVSQANNEPTEKEVKSDGDKPWNQPHVRPDLIRAVNLRLNEVYLLKLAYISEKTNLSQQEILRRGILPYLDEMAERY